MKVRGLTPVNDNSRRRAVSRVWLAGRRSPCRSVKSDASLIPPAGVPDIPESSPIDFPTAREPQ